MNIYKPMTVEEWHKRVRDAQAALDVAMRGELPGPEQTDQVAIIRGFINNLDAVVFRGFDILRPNHEPRQKPKCNISIEELFS